MRTQSQPQRALAARPVGACADVSRRMRYRRANYSAQSGRSYCMTNTVRRGLLALPTLASVITFPAHAGSPSSRALVDSLATAAPTLDRKVLDKAIAAMECAVDN